MTAPLEVTLDARDGDVGDVTGMVVVDRAEGFETVDLELARRLMGTASTTERVVDSVSIPVDPGWGPQEAPFTLRPKEGPPSYRGRLFRCEWTLRARGVRPGLDKSVDTPVPMAPVMDLEASVDTVTVRHSEAEVGLDTSRSAKKLEDHTWSAQEKLVGVVAAAAALVVLWYMGRDALELISLPGLPGIEYIVITGFGFAVLLWLIASSARQELAERVLGPVEVELPAAVEGRDVPVRIRFSPAKPVRLEDAEVVLRAQEQALVHRADSSNSEGVDLSRDHDRFVARAKLLEGARFDAGGTVELELAVPIPRGAPATTVFDEHRRIAWMVRVVIRPQGAGEWRWEQGVAVRPTDGTA